MRRLVISLSWIVVWILPGCGRGGEEPEAYDNTEEVEAYYAAHPERFTYATTGDLPDNLQWEDGSGRTPFGECSSRISAIVSGVLPRLPSCPGPERHDRSALRISA